MVRVLHEEHAFTDVFLKFLLARSLRIQADLVDQLFNSSEKRLARLLLLMAEFGKPEDAETLIPKITQETLAEMIGTTRSRVSFFMNRFRQLGFIQYNGWYPGSQVIAQCNSARLSAAFLISAFRAVSQLLWSHKGREEWFSLGENHERRLGFGLHQLRNRYSHLVQSRRRGEHSL
jgi:hypothetical protein